MKAFASRLLARVPPVVIYPTPADPRFISVTLLSGLAFYALLTPAFGRNPAQLAASLLSWVVADALLLIFYQKVLLVPLSALVPALAAFVLVDSPHAWPYAAVGAAAILSKHFLRVDGRHVFNPLNFGLVTGLLFFGGSVAFGIARFGDSPWLFAWTVGLGALVTWRSGRLDIALAYGATFLAGAAARSFLSGGRFLTAASPATNIVFYLYAFHMMTDPKTTPDTRSRRITFGVLVGLVDAALRWNGVVNAPLYALFVVLGLLPFFRKGEAALPGSFVWRLRSAPLPGAR